MFYLTMAAVPQLKPVGSIINTASINSDMPNPTLLAYAPTKGAIQNFTVARTWCSSHQPVCLAGADHLRPVPVPMAGGTVIQVDQAHLRIKRFFGTSENAVRTQIWIAISVYVLVAIIKEETSFGGVPAYAATGLVADALRETAAETSCCGRWADRKQPNIS
jgi:NAD(P)-dependent dehydrogenase (short-subunit alcohol dehydrogenase family)